MDALSHVLGAVRVTDAAFFTGVADGPLDSSAGRARAAHLPNVEQVIECHVVTSGSCWGGVLDGPSVELQAGDVVVFPRGGRLRRGASQARVIGGFLVCDAAAFNPLLSALPRVIHLRAAEQNDAVVRQLIEVALAQASSPTSGRSCVLSRLGELLFVEVMRRYLASVPKANAGWFAGLRDENIGRALEQIHRRPEHAWSLGELAKQAGLSRSMLAERFAELVGLPPIQYLARWRIQLAASLLHSGKSSVAEVAERVGYGSEAALSRAFKRCVGVAPSRYRQGRQLRKSQVSEEFRPPRDTPAPSSRNIASVSRPAAS